MTLAALSGNKYVVWCGPSAGRVGPRPTNGKVAYLRELMGYAPLTHPFIRFFLGNQEPRHPIKKPRSVYSDGLLGFVRMGRELGPIGRVCLPSPLFSPIRSTALSSRSSPYTPYDLTTGGRYPGSHSLPDCRLAIIPVSNFLAKPTITIFRPRRRATRRNHFHPQSHPMHSAMGLAPFFQDLVEREATTLLAHRQPPTWCLRLTTC